MMTEAASDPTFHVDMNLLSSPYSTGADSFDLDDEGKVDCKKEEGSKEAAGAATKMNRKMHDSNSPIDEEYPAKSSTNISAISMSASKISQDSFFDDIAAMLNDVEQQRDEMLNLSVKNAILMDEMAMIGADFNV